MLLLGISNLKEMRDVKEPTSNLWKALFLALLVPILVWAYAEGPPAAATGGFGEPNCTDCHTGTAVNAGGGKVTIAVSASSYTSGGTYTITVTDFDSQQRRWGFELSARTQAGRQAGTLQIGSDGFTQIASPAVNNIQYIEHTFNGTRNGTRDTGNGVSFNFTWVAPDVSAGPVVFNAAGNAANGDGTQFGDHIYTTSLVLQPQAQGPAPAVNSGGVVNGAGFNLTSSSLAPGSIAAIFGSNLSDGTVCVPPNCGPSFDASGKVIPTLAGAQVSFNGTPAPILSTPGNAQLNVQIPVEVAGAASATVVVTVNGQGSAPGTVSLTPLSPGLIAANASGSGQGAILNDRDANQGVQSFVAPVGSAPNAHPAAPGDVIEIYGTGLGAMTPSVPTGTRPQGLPQTVTQPAVTIGGISATVLFSGLASCCVGLNQVNVQVPAGTPAGNNVPVTLSIGGATSNTVTIAVQ
jgi:uncharacterized protein (TIGR03437 family)